MTLFEHVPHPRTRAHAAGEIKPVRTDDERIGLNGKIGLLITTVVGTMWCAYAFAGISLTSLPSTLALHSVNADVQWVAQTFLQLVLLSVILVGQNIQARASDKRATATYEDAKAVLHEAVQIQAHLAAQDGVLQKLAGQR